MTTIIVTHEDNEVDEFEFESGRKAITIGRRSTNDVCIPNLSVSGTHARISVEGTEAWLEDLGSTNGSYINGQLIRRHLVNNGDDVILGKIRLAFAHSAEVLSAAVAPAYTARREAVVENKVVKAEIRTPEIAGDFNDDSFAEEELHSSSANFDEFSLRAEASPIAPTSKSLEEERKLLEEERLLLEEERKRVVLESSQAQEISSSSMLSKEIPHPLDGVERASPAINTRAVAPTVSTPTQMHEFDTSSVSSNGAVIEIKNGAKSGQILPIDKPVTTLGRPGIQIAAIMRKPDGYFLMHIESDDNIDRPTLNQDAIGDEPVLLHSGDELTVAGIDVEFMLS